ncbi:MAG: hypothetical protein HY321_19755 [Armatimonadetes bacterium]|nr:hypothetical protein [Armatimonadota bacterium]
MARDMEESSPGDLEGGGPGGGTDIAREHGAEPVPGSRATLWLTVVLVALVLLVPVVWALGVYGRLVLVPGIDPAALAGYLLLVVMLLAAAVLYFWKQFSASA